MRSFAPFCRSRAARDFGDLLHAVALAAAVRACHELQVIDDHEIHILETAKLGLDLRHGDGGRIIQIDICAGENVPCLNQAHPFIIFQLAGAQLSAAHERFGGEQAGAELLLAHFQ